MLDSWAVADTEGHLLATHEGSIEEAHRVARGFTKLGGRVFLDGMKRVYEGFDEGEIPLAANMTRAQKVAREQRRLRVIAPETPFEDQPELAAAALGIEYPIETDEVLDLTIGEAHEQIADFFTNLPPLSGARGGVYARRWLDPEGAVAGMLGGNYKMDKTDERQERARVVGLSIAPNVLGFKGALRSRTGETVCLRSTRECRATCLVYTGQNVAGEYNNALKAAKAKALLNEPVAFLRVLHAAIMMWTCDAIALSYEPFLRLNVYADIPWELVWPGLFDEFPEVQFYDYTKVPGRRDLPENYDLTFSYSGRNQEDTIYEVTEGNRRVAAVFLVRRGADLPELWNELPVVDGDLSDLRPLDPPNPYDEDPVCVGLRYKPPRGKFSREKPVRGRDVFIIPCEVLDDDRVVVSLSPRHTFAFGEDALDEEIA